MTSQIETIRKFGLTDKLDQLYANSKNGDNAKRIYSDIVSEPNLLMAIHNIKTNDGANTPGHDGRTITWYLNQPTDQILRQLKNRLENYKPGAIIRVYIDKNDGDKRPLGIPTIEDRILQQAIKQILEPWCEARFHPHSYGFRPLRSAHHALVASSH